MAKLDALDAGMRAGPYPTDVDTDSFSQLDSWPLARWPSCGWSPLATFGRRGQAPKKKPHAAGNCVGFSV